MRSSWAPLLDNELVLDPGLPYFNVGGVLLVQEEGLLVHGNLRSPLKSVNGPLISPSKNRSPLKSVN